MLAASLGGDSPLGEGNGPREVDGDGRGGGGGSLSVSCLFSSSLLFSPLLLPSFLSSELFQGPLLWSEGD